MRTFKLVALAILLLSTNLLKAEIKNASTEKVNISGSCNLCKEGIERAAFEKGISKALWDKDTKIAVVTYNQEKTTINAVLKKIALAGYDNEGYLAPDDAYANLADCCQYERPVKATKKDAMAEKKMTDHLHVAETSTAKDTTVEANPMKPVLDAYYAVKDALVNTDTNAASMQASKLVKTIKATNMHQLPSEQHLVWMKVKKELDDDANKIANSKDVSQQRNYFSALSDNLYKVIKSTKPTEAVYYQHCPMAKEGKGANWLSAIPTIKNPYYGAQMLSCGSTTEILK